ncbi:DUF6297 family protein [Actinotalea sp.]|uniref:DUF6297 family protein n=1 Tax=Actinotalea sp. TaxID=1872145 RepID=UPI0035678785
MSASAAGAEPERWWEADPADLQHEAQDLGDPLEPAVGPEELTAFPAARSIRRYTVAVARQRSGAGVGELLGDVYYAVIMIAIGFGLALGVAGQLTSTAAPVAAAGTGASLPAVVAVGLVALAGVVLTLAGRLGPVGLGGAEATWWLGLPVERRGLVRPASRRIPLVAAAAGALVAGILDGGLLDDAGIGHVLRIAAAAALVCAGVVLLAGLAQSWRGNRLAVVVGDVIVAVSPVIAVLAVVGGWQMDGLPDAPLPVLLVGAVVVLLLAVALDRRLGSIQGRSLRESGSVAAQAAGALASMDSRELGRVLTDRVAKQRRRRSWRMRLVRGPGSAIVAADLVVLVRSPRHLVQVVVAALLPALVVTTPQLAGTLGVLVAIVGGGYVAMLATGEGARRAEMAPVLDRLLPLGAEQVRRLRLIVPGVVMLGWAVVAFGTIGLWRGDLALWLVLGVLTTPVWAGGALRTAYRPAPDWGGNLVSTPMGALPTGVAAVLARGPDVVVLGMVPAIIALVIGSVPPAVLTAQLLVSVIAARVGSSASTKTLMERLTDASAAPTAPAGGALR